MQLNRDDKNSSSGTPGKEVMTENEKTIERRSEVRTLIDKYFSVEFSKKGLDSLYHFKIWNISAKGMCIVVREDSDIINHLSVGDILDMKYYPVEESSPAEYSKTEITHTTKDDDGRFKGHYLVGLSILKSDSG
jgi:hypothetical protein